MDLWWFEGEGYCIYSCHSYEWNSSRHSKLGYFLQDSSYENGKERAFFEWSFWLFEVVEVWFWCGGFFCVVFVVVVFFFFLRSLYLKWQYWKSYCSWAKFKFVAYLGIYSFLLFVFVRTKLRYCKCLPPLKVLTSVLNTLTFLLLQCKCS